MIESPIKLQPGPLIARGLTSEVFAWGADRVLKLFYPWFRREKIEREFFVTQTIHAAGLAVPNAFELVAIDGRLGIVFERLEGISLMRHAARRPWAIIGAAKRFADLHAKMHENVAPMELPPQRKMIERWIIDAKDLPANDRAAAQEAVAKLPEGSAICHGDFHPENVFLTRRGPVIIDWTNGSRGNPIGDVARTASVLANADVPDDWPTHIRVLIATSRKILLKVYLRRYFELRGGSIADICAWDAIQKAAMSAWRARMDG